MTRARPDAEEWPSLWPAHGKAARTPKILPLTDGPGLATWTTRAACLGEWSTFDAPEHGESELKRAEQLTAARAICARCPVLRECDTFATTANPPVSGIWAGRRRYPTSRNRRTPA